MDADAVLAEHFAKVPVPGDGDCWINSVLVNYSSPPTVRSVREKVHAMVADNDCFQHAMDVKKSTLKQVTRQAIYTKHGKLNRYGAWGEYWHMPALAIVLGVDIICFSPTSHITYYSWSGANVFYPQRIRMDEIVRRDDLVTIIHNGTDHFDALIPTKKMLKLPLIGWHTVAHAGQGDEGGGSSTAACACDYCDGPVVGSRVTCVRCHGVNAHAECHAMFYGPAADFVCDRCE